tara:strand:+ start:29754 stop:30332 length:579 start_codon:yes stop_codon:yes gene_type:complete
MNMTLGRKTRQKSKLLLIFFVVSGCGFYSFRGSIPSHIKTISIPLFLNETAEFGVSESITDAITNTFIDENILSVTDENISDSVLKGTITKVTDIPYTYSEIEEVMEYRLNISIQMEWWDSAKDSTLISKNYSGWGLYTLTGDASIDGIDNDEDGKIDGDDSDEIGEPRELAFVVAVRKIANDVINDIVSTW